MNTGTLFVVATPIGNLKDLSSRAADTLRNVDVVAAEDTRRTQKLLSSLGLSKKMLRCDENSEAKATEIIIDKLQKGESVALVSDAGTPAISDPGYRLVSAVRRAGLNILPVPGPSAVTTALSLCGFPAVPFTFLGFLPKKTTQRERLFARFLISAETIVFFEAPYRIQKVLTEMARHLGSRPIFLGREISKMHEEYIEGPCDRIAEQIAKKKPLGEYTVVVSPVSKKEMKIRLKNRSTMEDE